MQGDSIGKQLGHPARAPPGRATAVKGTPSLTHWVIAWCYAPRVTWPPVGRVLKGTAPAGGMRGRKGGGRRRPADGDAIGARRTPGRWRGAAINCVQHILEPVETDDEAKLDGLDAERDAEELGQVVGAVVEPERGERSRGGATSMGGAAAAAFVPIAPPPPGPRRVE